MAGAGVRGCTHVKRCPHVKCSAQGARGQLGICGLGNRPHHGHARCACIQYRVDVGAVNAADGEEGPGGVLGCITHQLKSHGRSPWLGRSGVHRADAEVVGTTREVDLGGCMRGEANEQIGSHDFTHLLNAHVLLPHMHSVGPRREPHARAVVDDQQRIVTRTQGHGFARHGRERVVVQVLLAQLHDVHTARQCSTQHIQQLASAGTGSAHQIQARLGQAGAALIRKHGVSLTLTSITAMSSQSDVVVVGAGIIGLASAWRARQAGLSVTLLERGQTGQGTSRVAAGMLAPVAEVEFGAAGRRVLDLGLRSAAMWPEFAAELKTRTGLDVGLRRTGTLVVARDEDEARELERQLAFRASLELHAERLLPSAARELEPALTPTVRLALHAPEDHSVDPRLVLEALREACESEGVVVRERARVAALEQDGRRVTGVALDDGERIDAGQVVLAAGVWTSELELPPEVAIQVRPVKGQILRLSDPTGPGLLSRVVRFHGGYLVPRGDGRYVLGASMEERGHDMHPTAGGIYELLRDAHELVPGIAELRIEELGVGLRPSTPDNAPAIGPGTLDGLVWATGHHRNGILLAPLTAELVSNALTGRMALS